MISLNETSQNPAGGERGTKKHQRVWFGSSHRPGQKASSNHNNFIKRPMPADNNMAVEGYSQSGKCRLQRTGGSKIWS